MTSSLGSKSKSHSPRRRGQVAKNIALLTLVGALNDYRYSSYFYALDLDL